MVNGCDMRGYLSFLILWSLNKRELTGNEIAIELKRRNFEEQMKALFYNLQVIEKNVGMSRKIVVTDSPARYYQQIIQCLRRLKAKEAIFAVLGNHDHWTPRTLAPGHDRCRWPGRRIHARTQTAMMMSIMPTVPHCIW